MARSTKTTHRPITRSMTGPITRSSSRAGGRHTRSSAKQWDLTLCKKQSRAVNRRSSSASATSAEFDSRPSDVVNFRTRCLVRRTRQGNFKQIGNPEDGKKSVRCASSNRAAAHRKQSPPSKLKALEERLEVARYEIADLTKLVDEYKSNSAKAPLKNLEEYFTCPLCFEIMACPYSLHPRQCGHTFCAICILKWFFSRLHRVCGGWHEAVDCPLCRSPLFCTQDLTPRPDFTFPFVPNRAMDCALQGLITSLTDDLDNQHTITIPTGNLADWYEGGHARQEWTRRDRTGRTEMTYLAAQWTILKPMDFVNIKMRLEV